MTSFVEELNAISRHGLLKRIVPNSVSENLKESIELREYQIEAIARLRYYIEEYEEYNDRNYPVHLLYHMATGSGKTLLMASNILYLYKRGYRSFIFFVNSRNILEKTRANFLDKGSFKYLFAEKIVIDNCEVRIDEVDNFEVTNSNNISIHFTTIQGLHTRLNHPQENSVTLEDFERMKLVFLSDEAHHINTLTKQQSQLNREEQEELTSWENTVSRILQSNRENVMLEYTATVELSNEAIRAKYADKIIYQYSLKEFREDGFSKDVRLLQLHMDVMDRALQAVVLSQYRRKIAEKHNLSLKPVILFKSRRIEDSIAFQQSFRSKIRNLKKQDILKLKSNAQDVLKKVFDYFENAKVTPEDLITELKEDFSDEKCVVINSKSESENKETQIKLNTLEDYDNEIRAVFTVNMLNEGWDVLNLFDIVRLYETRDARYGKPGRTTIAEAQLIGRGARYYPFQLSIHQEKFKRKYDEDLGNEVRILEELHYHSFTDSRYIQELRSELDTRGITVPENLKKTLLVSIKPEIKATKFWEEGVVFINNKVKNNNASVEKITDIVGGKTLFSHHLKTGWTSESGLLEMDSKNGHPEIEHKEIKLSKIEPHISRKAIDKIEFYRFSHISQYFPKLKSIREFLTSSAYAGSLDVKVYGMKEQLENLSNQQKFEIALAVLNELSGRIKANSSEFVGTIEFKSYKISTQAKTKSLEILVNDSPSSDREYGVAISSPRNPDLELDLSKEGWYIYEENYGTSEEKHFIHFIKHSLNDLKQKYRDIYLLRNESLFKIYRFSDGRAIEPDFVLFLREKDSQKALSYQIFIEPKGNHLLRQDQWKEEFLEEIEEQFYIDTLYETGKYKLVGLPFYNETMTKQQFREVFEEKLKL